MKKLSLICAFMVVACFSSSVSAVAVNTSTVDVEENIVVTETNSTYLDILDKLNAEYGTSAHFPTENEVHNCDVLSLNSVSIDFTPEEFEEHMRYVIELNLRANANARESIDKLSTELKEDTHFFSFSYKNDGNAYVASANLGRSSSAEALSADENIKFAYYNSKDVEGATIHIGAYVNISRGFWAFSSVFALDVTNMQELNGDILFYPEVASYSFIDTRRTCATEFYGVTYDATTGIIIDDDAERYAEFWAGSGMPDPDDVPIEE